MQPSSFFLRLDPLPYLIALLYALFKTTVMVVRRGL
jgi:hypothetical protein